MDVGIPYCGHGPALDEEEDYLREVACGCECDDDPEEGCQAFAGPVDDPQDAEADGDFAEAYSYYVADLGYGAPFKGLQLLLWR